MAHCIQILSSQGFLYNNSNDEKIKKTFRIISFIYCRK